MKSIHFKNIFTSYFPSDPIKANYPRQVTNGLYSFVDPKTALSPSMIIYSEEVADMLGMSKEFIESEEFLAIMSGNKIAEGSQPYAMCYGGHQFGHWAGQLGDGRAINLGEIDSKEGIQTIQLKGAGSTPYSRTADGLAVMRSSVREFLCGEAMHYLGIPTTRALSLLLSGEEVLRDVMYDGNPAYEKGAILSRVSPSFVRFGSFEIWAARRDEVKLKLLADHCIENHFQHLVDIENKYFLFFNEIATKTCDLIIEWQRVGFVHGVMNTDNMSILGLTIDYGPYGWMDNYDPNWTPNTTDKMGRRYRFGNQPAIAQWNLLQLASALYPLVLDKEVLKRTIEEFSRQFTEKYQVMMLAKLGLYTENNMDKDIIKRTEQVLELCNIDYTIFFRLLAEINAKMSISEMKNVIQLALYEANLSAELEDLLDDWLSSFKNRLTEESVSHDDRLRQMNQVNPKYILRNYMAQMAIEAVDNGDYGLIDELFALIKRPYDDQPEYNRWFALRPDWALEKVGCSMLSCSS